MKYAPRFNTNKKIRKDLMDMGVEILFEKGFRQTSIIIADDEWASSKRLPTLRLPMTIDQARSLGVTLLDAVFEARGLK